MVVSNAVVSASQMQYDKFSENISLKANIDLGNTPNNIDYVVESFQLGNSWYREYKSGWIEQGGRVPTANVTVSFLIPFSNTNYTLLGSYTAIANTTAVNSAYVQCGGKTVSDFCIRSRFSGTSYGDSCDWYACGY